MQDADKPKEQRINELKKLRRRVAEEDKGASTDPAELRHRAEEQLKSRQTETNQRETNDTERLYYELETHQIELEMQNEGLRNALVQIEESRMRYSDLYDFAPVGYLTLDENGLVLEANLTIARQLGIERSRLVGTPLSGYMVASDRNPFRSHLGSVLKDKTHQACEVRFMKGSGGDFHALLDTMFVKDAHGERRVRTSATDITERKRMEEELTKYRDHLEDLVKERTAELAQSNHLLQAEITERKQAEDALRESEARYRAVIENIQDIFYRTDQNGTLVMASPSAAATLGYDSLDEILGTDIASYWLHADEREKMLLSLRKDGVVRDYEVVIKKKDGSPLVVSITSTFCKDDNGNILGVEGVIRDITKRKRAEDALYESELRLRTILQTVNEGFWLIDNDTVTIDLNPRMSAILDRNREEVYGKKIFDFVDGENKAIFEQQIRLRAQGEVATYEIALTRPDGSKVLCLFNSTPLFDGSGNKAGSFAMVTDISERKQVEDALRLSEARYRELFSAVLDPIHVFDADTLQFIDINESALRCYGYTREEFLNLKATDISADPENSRKSIEETVAEQRALLRYHRKKDGTVFPVEISAVRFLLRERALICGVVRDITERKRAEAEKEKLEAQLFQAQKMESVGRLAGGVAHDFNNMLGVIIGRAEMALQQDVSNAKLQHNLKEILKAGLRSADLTRQLLAFARKQTAIPKILDLNVTISGMLKMLRRLIGEDIALSWQPGLDLWKVKIDPSQVDQILANLVVNASDAIPGVGAITIRTENVVIDDSNRAETSEFVPGQYVLLTVSDTGTGMSKEVRENIFEPFFTTKEVGKGTGLGLSTVYGIVKQNDGFIYVASELGKETTFTICLPRFEVETTQIPSEQITVNRPTGTETILLVEDDEAILDLSKMILEELGYTVLAAHTPIYALHLAEEHPSTIDLLITDVVMPEMNGRDLAEQLRAIRPNLRCLYMSGYTADVIAHRGILDEGLNFMQKPFGSNDFAAKVREVLDHLE